MRSQNCRYQTNCLEIQYKQFGNQIKKSGIVYAEKYANWEVR